MNLSQRKSDTALQGTDRSSSGPLELPEKEVTSGLTAYLENCF